MKLRLLCSLTIVFSLVAFGLQFFNVSATESEENVEVVEESQSSQNEVTEGTGIEKKEITEEKTESVEGFVWGKGLEPSQEVLDEFQKQIQNGPQKGLISLPVKVIFEP